MKINITPSPILVMPVAAKPGFIYRGESGNNYLCYTDGNSFKHYKKSFLRLSELPVVFDIDSGAQLEEIGEAEISIVKK